MFSFIQPDNLSLLIVLFRSFNVIIDMFGIRSIILYFVLFLKFLVLHCNLVIVLLSIVQYF